MRAVRVERPSAQKSDLNGRVLCHELRGDDGRVAIAKGRVLDDEDSARALTLDWSALPSHLDVETRLSRLSAWVLAAERTTRPFALLLPAQTLPTASGREHRRNALTALALMPGDAQ